MKGIYESRRRSTLTGKKAMSPEMIAIILLVVGLAVIAMFFIYLATQGKIFLGNTTQLNITYQ